MKSEVDIALENVAESRTDACEWVRRTRRIVDAVREETPAWHVWRTTPYRIASGVLMGLEHALCGG